MVDWGGGWSAAGGLTLMVGMVAVVALVAAGIFLLIGPVFGRPDSFRHEPNRNPVTQGSTGLELLDGRNARGEITQEEPPWRGRQQRG